MDPRSQDPLTTVRRARRGARDQRGLTTTHLMAVAVVTALGLTVILVVAGSRSTHRQPTKPTVTPSIEPVLRTLDRDLAGTKHALVLDIDGCGHAKGQRAVVSFLADGSAPERASWYVESRGGRSVLVHRDCRNGTLQSSSVVTEVSGAPIIACTPSCGAFESIRFSYTGPRGLSSVVAYRTGAPR